MVAVTSEASLDVLVVDNQQDVLDAMTIYLGEEGMRVVQATDGIDALSCLYARRPMAVLIDVLMPRMNGIELIQQIRQDRSPIFAMSGDRDALRDARIAGANETMMKPIDPKKLVAMLRRIRESAD
jgi:DNA-binding response OmpR family regulator